MRIVKHIPNTITSMNLLCGVVGVILSLKGRPDTAFLFMLAAAVFDFCDGLAARMLGAYSDIGKELDSLADDVSFGVLPSVMLYVTIQHFYGDSWVSFLPLVLAAFSALRLAKFNIDERQHDSFIGLATPSSAMICGSLCHFVYMNPDSHTAALISNCWVLPVLALVLSLLLVSEIPMFAFKFGKGKTSDRITSILRLAFVAVIVLSAILVAVLGYTWSMVVFISFIGYILINVVALFVHRDA